MIKFLTKGLLRDRSRSLFPVLVITLTVTLVIFTIGFMKGTMNSLLLDTAVILTGHEKVVTRAYSEESQLMPNDLALMDVDQLIENLEQDYPDFFWSPRITFAGLLDVPDENGETKAQGPVIAFGIDFLSNGSPCSSSIVCIRYCTNAICSLEHETKLHDRFVTGCYQNLLFQQIKF